MNAACTHTLCFQKKLTRQLSTEHFSTSCSTWDWQYLKPNWEALFNTSLINSWCTSDGSTAKLFRSILPAFAVTSCRACAMQSGYFSLTGVEFWRKVLSSLSVLVSSNPCSIFKVNIVAVGAYYILICEMDVYVTIFTKVGQCLLGVFKLLVRHFRCSFMRWLARNTWRMYLCCTWHRGIN